MEKEEKVDESEIDEKDESGGDQEKADAVLELAVKMGYNPNYDGVDREFKSPEEFILNSKNIQNTMSKQMKALKAEVEDHKIGLKQLQKHNETVYKAQIAQMENRIAELKAQKKEAIRDEDPERAMELDEQIGKLEKTSKEKPPEVTEVNPEFKKWVAENEWYTEDDELCEYANIQAANNPKYKGLSAKRLYAMITKDVKKMFPEKFEQKEEKSPDPPKPKAAVVESSSRKSSSKSKFTEKDLSDNQRETMKRFIRLGAVKKKQDYIDELARIGELS